MALFVELAVVVGVRRGAANVQAARAGVLDLAYAAHPERFSHRPHPLRMPTQTWINDPSKEANIRTN